MSTAKGQDISHTNSTNKFRDDVPALKSKITELERQVNEYKVKLDELRRAKATTVVKLEREYVNTNTTGFNRSDHSRTCDRCENVARLIQHERKSREMLQTILEQKDERIGEVAHESALKGKSCVNCSRYRQLVDIERQNGSLLTTQLKTQRKLREEEQFTREVLERSIDIIKSDRIRETQSHEQLRRRNEELRNKSRSIAEEHERTMNEIACKDETLQKKIEIWAEMHQEWIDTMQRRVLNLQLTDEELQIYLKHHTNVTQQTKPLI